MEGNRVSAGVDFGGLRIVKKKILLKRLGVKRLNKKKLKKGFQTMD
eukprot:COSAG06_NODE_66652_length_254_cov_0.329032_1_plen_45_part_01